MENVFLCLLKYVLLFIKDYFSFFCCDDDGLLNDVADAAHDHFL